MERLTMQFQRVITLAWANSSPGEQSFLAHLCVSIRAQSKNGVMLRILRACGNKQTNKQTPRFASCTSVSSKPRIVLGMCFLAPPTYSGEEWVYFSCCYSCVSMEKHGFCQVQLVIVTIHLTQVTLLNPQSVNCTMLWIKLLLCGTSACLTFIPSSPLFMPPMRAENMPEATSGEWHIKIFGNYYLADY